MHIEGLEHECTQASPWPRWEDRLSVEREGRAYDIWLDAPPLVGRSAPRPAEAITWHPHHFAEAGIDLDVADAPFNTHAWPAGGVLSHLDIVVSWEIATELRERYRDDERRFFFASLTCP